eukprot:scaffold74382_cov45-Phaeocystis_antarctica.AAC.1
MHRRGVYARGAAQTRCGIDERHRRGAAPPLLCRGFPRRGWRAHPVHDRAESQRETRRRRPVSLTAR